MDHHMLGTFRGGKERKMRYRIGLSILLMGVLFSGIASAAGEEEKSLRERVRALEERLGKLDRVEVIKKVTESVCPDGEVYDTLPPGGRCPDGTIPEERATFRKIPFSRRESISERIEAAILEAESKKVAVGGSARGIVQQILHGRESDHLFSTGSVDLFFLSRPMVFSTFFLDLEATGGGGPDETVASRSRLNADAETLGVGVTDQVKVREAWLYFKLLSERLRIVGGKLDLTNYFDRNAVANDETTRFLNTAFVNNPLLKQPPNGPGLALLFESRGEFTAGAAIQSSNNSASAISEKVYAVAELGLRTHLFFSKTGNVRLWGRTGRLPESLETKTWGAGVSVDQQVTPRVTLFARAGIGRTEREREAAHAWSTGFALLSPLRAWIRDRMGVAFSRQAEPGGSENIAEGYYHHFVSDRLAVAFDLQWLFSGIHSATGQRQRHVVVPGIRTTIGF